MAKRTTTVVVPATIRQVSALRKALSWRWQIDLLAQFSIPRATDAEGWNVVHADLAETFAQKGAGKEEVSAALDYLLNKRRKAFHQEEVESILGFKLGGKAASKPSPSSKAAGDATPKASNATSSGAPTRADLVSALLAGRITEEGFKLALAALSMPAEETTVAPTEEQVSGESEDEGGEETGSDEFTGPDDLLTQVNALAEEIVGKKPTIPVQLDLVDACLPF